MYQQTILVEPKDIAIGATIPYQDPILGTTNYMISKPIKLFPHKRFNNTNNINNINNNGIIFDDNTYTLQLDGNKITFKTTTDKMLSIMNDIYNNLKNNNVESNNQLEDTLDDNEWKSLNLNVLTKNGINNITVSNEQDILKKSGNYSIINGNTRNKYLLYYDDASVQITYTGAGIMIFENNYISNKNILSLNNRFYTKSGPTVILFRSVKTNQYEELGGSIDLSDFEGEYTLINTAIREALEESCNLFNFKGTKLMDSNRNKKSANNVYICYGVNIVIPNPDYLYVNFQKNLSLLKQNNASYVWKEMDDVKRFYISDLIDMIKKNETNCLDANGTTRCIISSRTIKCLNAMLKKNNNDDSIFDICMTSPKKINQVNSTYGTTSYLVL